MWKPAARALENFVAALERKPQQFQIKQQLQHSNVGLGSKQPVLCEVVPVVPVVPAAPAEPAVRWSRWAQNRQPIPHCPPRWGGRCANHSSDLFPPQDVVVCEPSFFHLCKFFSNLETVTVSATVTVLVSATCHNERHIVRQGLAMSQTRVQASSGRRTACLCHSAVVGVRSRSPWPCRHPGPCCRT